MIHTIFVGDASILVVEDVRAIRPEQRGAIMGWSMLRRNVTQEEGKRYFPRHDHVVYVGRVKRFHQPTTPLDVEHEDIRSERPCT